MANFNFTVGIRQWGKMIPQAVKNIRDTVIYLAGSLGALTTVVAPKLNLTDGEFATWCGVAVVAAKAGAKLFGVHDDVAKEIAQETIKKIDDKKEAEEGAKNI